MNSQLIRKDIFELIKEAVKDGLIKIQEIEKSGEYIGHYCKFPKMNTFESGFPQFSECTFDEGPKEYKAISKKVLNPVDLVSWKTFYHFALNDPELSSFWQIRECDLNNGDILHSPHFFQIFKEHLIYHSIEKLIDRYIHITKNDTFNENAFLPIYKEWENATLTLTVENLRNISLSLFSKVTLAMFNREIYFNEPAKTKPEDLVTEVQVPVEKNE